MGLSKNIALGETISVLLEKIEDKNGDVVVSASKAQKLKVGINLFKHMKKKSLSWVRLHQSVKVDAL